MRYWGLRNGRPRAEPPGEMAEPTEESAGEMAEPTRKKEHNKGYDASSAEEQAKKYEPPIERNYKVFYSSPMEKGVPYDVNIEIGGDLLDRALKEDQFMKEGAFKFSAYEKEPTIEIVAIASESIFDIAPKKERELKIMETEISKTVFVITPKSVPDNPKTYIKFEFIYENHSLTSFNIDVEIQEKFKIFGVEIPSKYWKNYTATSIIMTPLGTIVGPINTLLGMYQSTTQILTNNPVLLILGLLIMIVGIIALPLGIILWKRRAEKVIKNLSI